MRDKYAKFLDGTRSVGGSSNWKRLMQVKEAAGNHIAWILRKGNMNFWIDKWLDGVKIADVVLPPIQLKKFAVRQVLLDEDTALSRCQSFIPHSIMQQIRA